MVSQNKSLSLYEISQRGPKNYLSFKDRDERKLIFPVIITVHVEQT